MRRERKQYNKRERKPNTTLTSTITSSTLSTPTTPTPTLMVDGTSLTPISVGKSAIKQQQQAAAAAALVDDELRLLYTEILDKLLINEANIDAKLEQELELNGLLKRIINVTTMHSNPMMTMNNNNNNNQQQLKQLIIDYVGKECIVLIRWAKTIHNYQTLNLNDQAHLIESNFMEILLLNFIWRTCIHSNVDLNMIYFHKQFKLNRFLCKELNLMNIFDSIIQICKNFIQLRVNIKEYLCLKTIILLKSGNRLIPH